MKKQKRKLYIVPGFGESTRAKNYCDVIKHAREKDFFVIPITIEWDGDKSMDDYIKEVETQIPDKNAGDVILGFSFGAYITYVISKKKVFDNYIFCTISPYFKENLKDLSEESKNYLGKNLIDSLKKYSIHQGNDSNVWFLAGEKDWESAIDVNKEAKKNWSGRSKFILIEGAGHELGYKKYTKSVNEILTSLMCEM